LKMAAVSPFKVYCLGWHRHDFTFVYLENFATMQLGMLVVWDFTLRRWTVHSMASAYIQADTVHIHSDLSFTATIRLSPLNVN